MSAADEAGELQARTARLVRVQRDQRTLPAKLEAIAGLVQRTVPGCDSVSIALVAKGRSGTAAWSSDIAIEADLAQYRSGEGPCILSASRAHPVRIDVLAHDQRFEHFAPLALEVGVESVLSVPLEDQTRVVGSINLYSQRPEAFDDRTPESIAPIVSFAVELIKSSPLYVYTLELLEHLELTIEHQDAIETAVAMLMENNRCDETTAIALLRSAADQEDRELVDAAQTVIGATAAAAGSWIEDLDEPPTA